jgi:hypothetical protein
MKQEFQFLRCAMGVAMAAALVFVSGCKFGANNTAAGSATSAVSVSRPSPNKFSPTDASICLQQMIKNSPGPFHLSFA